MFVLDSLFLSGFRWVLETVRNAAEAEQDDDTALREQLMAAEMRRELGEISDDEFAAIEADLLARIREIKERREGGSGPIAFGGESSGDGQLAVEATVEGDFHDRGEFEPPGTIPTIRTSRTPRTVRTIRTSRTIRTPRTIRTARTPSRRKIRKP